MTLLFTGLGVLYFVFIFLFRNRFLFTSKRLSEKKKELAPIISNFLFHHEEVSIAEKKDYVQLKIEIRDALKEPPFRRILSQILLDLQKDVSGETKKKLNELYLELDLHLDAYKKLKSWRWEVISQGIRELTQMQVEDSYRFITRFINDKRGVIRKQAEIATVSLRDEGIAHFLDTTRYGISEWQQLKLMEVLRGMEHFRPPSFKTWLVSRNKDVVLFTLRLIRRYNQNEAAASIIELVKHKDERVRQEAILCIKEFCLLNALPLLRAIFPKTGQLVKIEILDTLATLGNQEDVEFLKKVAQGESSFMVKNKAQMALNEIEPETIKPSHGLIDNKELDRQMASQEQDNERIQDEIKKIAEDYEINKEEETHVEEIEVFEIDTATEKAKAEEEKVLEDPPAFSDAREPDVKIGPIAHDLDSSINDEIGLVGADPETYEVDIEGTDGDNTAYLEMSDKEKQTFVELLEESASTRDLELLEDIVQKEPSSELRFRIFSIIKTLKAEDKRDLRQPGQGNIESTAQESIFHDLLEHASDIDSKCILITEIIQVGDEKELPLLELLLSDENPTIKKYAGKAKKELLQKLNQNTSKNPEIAPALEEPEPQENSKNLLPLELCFLEEFGIDPPKEEDGFDIGFDLADEFYEEQNRRLQTINTQ